MITTRDRRLYPFFSGHNNHRAPARQTTVSFFFPDVMKISRHDKKTANFPSEPKTDTTAQPARQTTVFFPVVIARTEN